MAIKVVFPEGISEVITQSLHQWDYGQVLELEIPDSATVVEVHFACEDMEEAEVTPCVIVNNLGYVTIPNRCLERDREITAWVYEIADQRGTTTKTIHIPVIARPRPSVADDNIPQDVSNRYTALITEVNEAIDALESGDVTLGTANRANAVGVGSGQYQDIRTALLSMIYPIGSIYMSVADVSPATFLGGTWVAWGAGRVPVGVDTIDPDFRPSDFTGGEKSHVLTINQMPKHDHAGSSVAQPQETLYRPPVDEPYDATNVPLVQEGVNGSTFNYEIQYSEPYKLSSSGNGVSYTPRVVAEHGVPSQGGGRAHNNLQPYITCYMWKRTA